MEEIFHLKHYGELSLFEMNCLSAEDRAWILRRVNQEAKNIRDSDPKRRTI